MRNSCYILLFCLYLFSACKKETELKNDIGTAYSFKASSLAPGLELGEIYHTANFAAFTDLAYYNNYWYAVFRIGTNHVGGEDGQIKILKSEDGVIWRVMNIISLSEFDLRDPKLTIDSLNNNLYLSFFGRATLKYERLFVQNFIVKLNKETNSWSSVELMEYEKIDNEQFILWRPTFHDGKMHCIAYRTPNSKEKNDNLRYFISDNNSYTQYKFLNKIMLDGGASETTVRFNQNDSMYTMVRTELVKSPLGTSVPVDYTNVTWTQNPLFTVLASPNFLFYNGKLLITGRDSQQRTFKFFSYDPYRKIVEKSFTFPSGYETGYAGMSFNPKNENEIWITYYSITNTSSSINLAKIDLLTFLK